MFNSGDRIEVIAGVHKGEEGTINLISWDLIFYMTDTGIQKMVDSTTDIIIKPEQHIYKPHPLTKIFQNETTT